jgi:hypothetical protein
MRNTNADAVKNTGAPGNAKWYDMNDNALKHAIMTKQVLNADSFIAVNLGVLDLVYTQAS